MLKLLGLATPPQVIGQGQHCELPRQLQAWTPITQHIELGVFTPPEVSQSSQRGRGPFKEQSLTWSEIFVLTAWLPSLLGSTMGTPGTSLIPWCNCWCSDTSDCSSNTGSQSHRSGSKTGQIFHNSHLQNTPCLRHLSQYRSF